MRSSHTAAPRGGGARRSLRAAIVTAVFLAPWATPPRPARAQLYYEPLPEHYYADDRVRFTPEVQLGASFGRHAGFGVGTAIAIGLQLNDIIATYAVHRLWISDLIGSDESAFAVSHNAAVFDLTLFEWFSIGAGPSLDVGIGVLCAHAAQRCEGLGDLRIGIEGRASLVLGTRTPARRRGPALVLTVHPTFVEREVALWTVALGLGYQLF